MSSSSRMQCLGLFFIMIIPRKRGALQNNFALLVKLLERHNGNDTNTDGTFGRDTNQGRYIS